MCEFDEILREGEAVLVETEVDSSPTELVNDQQAARKFRKSLMAEGSDNFVAMAEDSAIKKGEPPHQDLRATNALLPRNSLWR